MRGYVAGYHFIGDDKRDSDHGEDWDRSVFDTDRFRKRGSGYWVDREDVSM